MDNLGSISTVVDIGRGRGEFYYAYEEVSALVCSIIVVVWLVADLPRLASDKTKPREHNIDTLLDVLSPFKLFLQMV